MDIFSYETLQIIWFVLWGLLWAVYFVLDGFDLGVGTLLPVLGKTDYDRRVMFNSTGPFWDGNEVWLITAGGVTFAAFPKAYAVLFSSLYAPLLLLLFALIFRAVSFEFRNKIDSPGWRKLWDTMQFVGSFLPALLLGVAFANLFQGIPIDANGVYHGSLLGLLNVYGLAGGLFFVAMFCMHGAIWLAIRTEKGDLHDRVIAAAKSAWAATLALAVVFLMATSYYTNLFANYQALPVLWLFPLLAVVMLLAARFFIAGEAYWLAFGASALFILCITFFGVFGMFPALVPSSMDPAYSVTMAQAASSFKTLQIMLVVTLMFIPLVIAYQAWVYTVFSFKLTREEIMKEHAY